MAKWLHRLVSTSNHSRWVLIVVLIIASFLRLYRISDHAEFLADQGSAGVVIYEAWQHKTIPLHGPATSTGQFPGPLYYYLIAPSLILTGFDPIAPAVFFALLGVLSVYIIYKVGLLLGGGEWMSLGVAALYATSPLVVQYSRNMWNPTAIPFFILLLFVSLITYHISRKKQYIFFSGLVCGGLIQLHYSNVYTIFASATILVGSQLPVGGEERLCLTKLKRFSSDEWISVIRNAALALGMFVVGFLVILLPFMLYEFQHGFEDIFSLLHTASAPGDPRGKRAMLSVFIHVLDRVGNFTLSDVPMYVGVILSSVLVLASLMTRRYIYIVSSLWLVGGAAFFALYSPVLYDHYIFYLLPMPFVLLTSIPHVLQMLSEKHALKKRALEVCVLVLLMLSIGNLMRSDVWGEGVRDIARTRTVTSSMIEQAEGRPYSFTIFSSRSFSDYHYRFFFIKAGIVPEYIDNKTYNTLFIICEAGECPIAEALSGRIIDVMCFDHHCGLHYPKLWLSDWSIEEVREIEGATLYRFGRIVPVEES